MDTFLIEALGTQVRSLGKPEPWIWADGESKDLPVATNHLPLKCLARSCTRLRLQVSAPYIQPPGCAYPPGPAYARH